MVIIETSGQRVHIEEHVIIAALGQRLPVNHEERVNIAASGQIVTVDHSRIDGWSISSKNVQPVLPSAERKTSVKGMPSRAKRMQVIFP